MTYTLTHADMHRINNTPKTAAYYARIGAMSNRAIREYEDWAWLQNIPANEITLTMWERAEVR